MAWGLGVRKVQLLFTRGAPFQLSARSPPEAAYALPRDFGALSVELREAIERHRSDLVALLSGAPAVDTRQDATLPLSELQQAYWFGERDALDPGDTRAHIYVEIELAGADPEVDRVEQSIESLIARHEALRSFVLPSGQQRILAQTPAFRIERSRLRDRIRDKIRLNHFGAAFAQSTISSVPRRLMSIGYHLKPCQRRDSFFVEHQDISVGGAQAFSILQFHF